MNFETRRTLPALFAGLLLLATVGDVLAGKASTKKDSPAVLIIEHWLVLGPAEHPLPVFHDSTGKEFGIAKLLDEPVLPALGLAPTEGQEVAWFSGDSLRWQARTVGKKNRVALSRPAGAARERPAVTWLAAYIAAPRWQSVEFSLEGSHPRRAWLDGRAVVSGGTGEADAAQEPLSGTLELTPGKHVLLVETLFDPERSSSWTVGASLSGEATSSTLSATLEPARSVELRDILDPPTITALAISPDGATIATSVQRTIPGGHDSESWVEIRATADGKRIGNWRGAMGASQLAFSPDGRYLSYLASAAGSSDGETQTLFLHDGSTHRSVPLLEGLANLSGYIWSPTSRTIAYSVTEKAEKDKRGVKRLEGVMDRWADHRDRQFLHIVAVPGGARRRLTTESGGDWAHDFTPDGTKLLFSRVVEQLENRPYSRTELWELKLDDFTATKLRDFAWFSSAIYSPGGSRILVATQPSEFGDAGLDVDAGTIANSYDGQLFIWDPVSSDVDPITRGFDPAVNGAAWSRVDGKIYLTAAERDFVRLYRYDVERRTFDVLDTGVDVFGGLRLARGALKAVGSGSSPWQPQSLLALDLESGTARRLDHPAGRWFDRVGAGQVESWDFRSPSGQTIEGRVYLPPDFDPNGSYPCIVYYYGGTSPVSRGFGGRYPKEWWAAQGYVVYVPQPSGAFGFGQRFSALHVNDWGRTTSEEIIEGVERFLETHSYVDGERVGCIGASYGGFMTMLLSTKSDLFAAAVSHAGISSIASYWGEGYWGYAYNSVSAANSFPWNRPELYVDQSPLFRADENRVPILLTHGSADTNVPVGESDAFYIALKLLGKQVEYVQIEGEDHWILAHEKRAIWSSTIVAWFERWLKDEPEWWNSLWGPLSQADAEAESR